MRHSAEMTGATVIDRVSVLVTHLSSIIADNAARLLSREDVRVLTEGVKQVNPSAIDDLVPGMLSLAELQRVLQGLLAERIPINDLGAHLRGPDPPRQGLDRPRGPRRGGPRGPRPRPHRAATSTAPCCASS